MPDSPAVEAKQLTKRFKEATAVHPLNFEVHAHEIFGFLGPNGAGKTTTMRMLAGLLEPSGGDGCIHGKSIKSQPLEAKQQLAYLPDKPDIYPKLTGWEFLQFIASVFKLDKNVWIEHARSLLQRFDLTESAGRLMETYSHGMKQKMALTGALIHQPSVIFLDEPTVGLDPKSSRDLRTILRETAADGTAVFFSTHMLDVADQLCDRVGIIHEGRLLQTGTPYALKQEHASYAEATLEDVFLRMTAQKVSQGSEGEIP
ncbi:ABC transporter ATP-binding protein [Marinococcus halophilus]|uniref:ABC transporter n=1 Tax=Marinococcus halophilus TaxID=1371 RepID=A0A510Y6D7_MARHA|nr:ABC transporter ATP-binding protein [Marinococcus halophilus]OZT80574.1 ABC transporter ATP-binding protein [Marinococcus halophilus]GEK58930.1 ABC transporter [Marinococcus halophilus]